MKKMRWILPLLFFLILMTSVTAVSAQCSICTRTAQELGERPAKALNAGIIYLAFTPLALIGFLGYRWWRNENQEEK